MVAAEERLRPGWVKGEEGRVKGLGRKAWMGEWPWVLAFHALPCLALPCVLVEPEHHRCLSVHPLTHSFSFFFFFLLPSRVELHRRSTR